MNPYPTRKRSHSPACPLLLGLLAACSPSGDGTSPDGGSGTSGIGPFPPSPAAPAFPAPLADPNQDGQAPALHLVGLAWGRLADVHSIDPATGESVLAYADFVIGEDVETDGVDYELETLLGSQEVRLTILHPRPSAAFSAALDAAQAGLVPIADRTTPPFSVVPRNAAIELRFDDLLDPATVSAETVRLLVGHPADQPFEARVLADPNHVDRADPDGDGNFELYPTRVIVDLSVSELESLESDPPLPVNPEGLPAATDAALSDAILRLPTRTDPQTGQTEILRNLAGKGLAFTGNGSNDPSVPTADVVRSFRGGGDSDATGDLYDGFLRDDAAPALVGELAVQLGGPPVADPERADVYTYPSLTYVATGCAPTPEPGDGLAVGGVLAVVEGHATQDGNAVTKLRVRVVHPAGALPGSGAAVLTTRFEAADAPCFLGFVPAAGMPPNLDVAPEAAVSLRFSEPMRAASLAPFDSYWVARVPSDPSPTELVSGAVLPATNLREFRFVPTLPLAHAQGTSEEYYAMLGTAGAAPTDLAGNALPALPSALPFSLDRAAATVISGSIVLRFHAVDELYGDGLPEVRGQFLYDLQAGELDPRPVQRFSYAVDTDEPIPSVMTPFPPGVQTPLTPLGSKMHSLWRYVDLGWDFTDESLTNVDVEGLSWAPVGGQVVTDAYDEFQIALGHSGWQPDEALNPSTGFPQYPNSGLVKTYANNFLTGGGGTVVHPKERGYVVSPADLFTSESGKTMMPWPLNRSIPLEEFEYYTWRDTAVLQSAGFSGAGVLLQQEVEVLGLPSGLVGAYYAPGTVRSIGLPLLMEFRCYPDSSALGLNAFEVLLAANSSSMPAFRAYSAGGFDTNGQPVIVDPDMHPMATGGFNPNSTPPGAVTPPLDNLVYTGQVDLVTRVSRAHGIWLPTNLGPASFEQPVVLPRPADLPAGTELRLDWRGAVQIANAGQESIAADAGALDPYGDPVSANVGVPVFLDGDSTWSSDLTELDGAAWIQFRVTFVGNAATQRTPSLSALGISFFSN